MKYIVFKQPVVFTRTVTIEPGYTIIAPNTWWKCTVTVTPNKKKSWWKFWEWFK